MHEYAGAIHIHSTYSDGTGTIPEIAQAADEVGLDFIMMSDHNSLKAKRDGWEGYHGGVRVLIGYEINDKQDKNHYLAFGLDETVGVKITAQEYVRRVKERGGIGFIAHPDEERSSMEEHPPYPWLAWDSQDFTGIEIWNHMSEWMEGLTEDNKYQRFIHPLKSIISPPQKTLQRWDELNLQRRVVGIGGVDAHAHKVDIMGFFQTEVFPYKVMFKSIRTYVLLDKPLSDKNLQRYEEDKQQIYEALRQGRSFIGNYYHADPKGFRFYAKEGKNCWNMGDYISYTEGTPPTMYVELPQEARLRLLCNGLSVAGGTMKSLEYTVTRPGAYRVEAWLDGKGWIFSNHIRVGVGEEV
ncbi:MAG: histidinol-phosphatase [Ectothiorhodospiraceae bacterium]|nr:histidinol-phosphatase [Ectothiorhodospiraceae bacterium]